jgi:hypothetical protein
MGWSFRKSLGLLPGVRINLSKTGPRLSVGIPGLRASVDMRGQTRLYGGTGPLRYQKNIALGSHLSAKLQRTGLLVWFKRALTGQ